MVADSDLALGQLVDTDLALEDLVVLGHLRRRGRLPGRRRPRQRAPHPGGGHQPLRASRARSSTRRYDLLSVVRSMELIMGMKALSLNDALATPMYDAFTSEPLNSAPVDCHPRQGRPAGAQHAGRSLGGALEPPGAGQARRRPAVAAGRDPLEVGVRRGQHAAAAGPRRGGLRVGGPDRRPKARRPGGSESRRAFR